MEKLDICYVIYHGIDYAVTTIPDVISGSDCYLTIGSESLNHALFSDIHGYSDEAARILDEKIYAYMDDDSFLLSKQTFLERVKESLD